MEKIDRTLKKKKLKVVFRKDRETREVVAYFPEIKVGYGNLRVYREGSGYDIDTYKSYLSKVKATEEEYYVLLRELEILENIKFLVRKKIHYDDLMKSWGKAERCY